MSGSRRYRCGSLLIEGDSGVVYRGGDLIPLPPKVVQTLLLLLDNQGQVVDKEFLLRTIWPDSFVEEGNLHHNISVLRKLLRAEDGAVTIETVPKRGYRLVGVTIAPDEPPPAILPPAPPKRRLVAGLFLVLVLGLATFAFSHRRMSGKELNSTSTAHSIAVLPFSNFSSDPNADYLGDGLTDEIIHALTRVPGLHVVGRTSTFQYKGKALDLRQIGEQLQARLVLEGSVQKEGARLRITAQLIDASTGLHIWSERFDRRFDDVFAVQDEICHAIAGALSVQLSGPAKKTTNTEVYSLYLRGLREWNRRNSAGVKAGKQFFERALALDPSYAPAWAGLADTLVHSGVWNIIPPNEALPKAKAAALKAIELDGHLAEPHPTLGYVLGWYERDHTAAEKSFRRALELSPGYVWGRQRLGSYLSALGRHDQAIAEYRRALELDPISMSANSGLALVYFWARQYDRAIEQCAKAREIDPQFPLTYYYLAHTLEQKHRYEDAITAMREGTRLWGSSDKLMLAELLAAAPGHRTEALAEISSIQKHPDTTARQPYQMALFYAALSDKDSAFAWLDRASLEGDSWFLYANVDPRLDPLRNDPRFEHLRQRLGI